MVIERTDDEIIIRLSASLNTDDLQGMVDYLAYKEATAASQSTQDDVDRLADLIKKGRGELAKQKLQS